MDTSSKAYKLLSLIAISGECSKDVYPFLYLTDSYNEKLMIPMDATATYTVTFTAELYQGKVLLGSYDHEVKIENVEFKLKPLNPIEFKVDDVEDWNQDEVDQILDVPTTQSGN